jgi:cytochrome c oxidase subunit 2
MPSDHDEKRAEIADEVTPIFKGGPIWRRPVGKIALVWLFMTAFGVIVGLLLPSHIMPKEMAPQFKDARETVVLFTVLAAPVAALVWATAFYSLIAWRKKKSGASDTPPPDGPPLRGNSLVSGLWVGTSVVLVVVLLIWGMAVLASQTAQQSNVLQINVTGQQWLWSYSYPGTGVTTHELVVPLDRQVEFNVTSVDVTHGFWPIEFGTQVDANPGFITRITVQPNKLGPVDVRCSQLCGLYHSYMYTPGRVVTSSNFASWLQSQGASMSSVQSYALGAK